MGESTLRDCPLPERPDECRLPQCFCSKNGTSIPGNLAISETPQMVILTFDDAVNGKTIDTYKTLFDEKNFRNRNNCPIKATFFVSHEWNNYADSQWVYWSGNEVAVNSIT